MMDRNRELRRVAMAAANGGGAASRRRQQQQRATNLRDFHEENGASEMREPAARLRDRGIKKDQDRDREKSSSKSKKRKGNREEGDYDYSSEESMDDGDDGDEDEEGEEEEEEEEDASVSVRLPPPTSNSSSMNHHVHLRSSTFQAKWKVADEMIGVSIPRKARSSCLKRSGGSAELIHRQAPISPAISPSSSNIASVRKKKHINGMKDRPAKLAKTSAPSSTHENEKIEMEVAEVLFGMKRQAPSPPNGFDSSSQPSVSPPSNSPTVAHAPKGKRLRTNVDEESPLEPARPEKIESEMRSNTEASSPSRSEKIASVVFPIVENGLDLGNPSPSVDAHRNPGKLNCNTQVLDSKGVMDVKDENRVKGEAVLASKAKEYVIVEVATEAAKKDVPANDSPREEKLIIDLMAPPPLPEKSFSEKEGLLDFVSDHKSQGPEKMDLQSHIVNGEQKKVQKVADDRNSGKLQSDELYLMKQTPKEKISELQLDLAKQDKDPKAASKQQSQAVKIDSKQEKAAQTLSLPLPLPVPIPGWPSSFPPFGSMGQAPPPLQPIVPMDGTPGSAKTLQPQLGRKRCATHSYIAQNIHYHQQLVRMNPFWPSIYGPKPYNVNAIPPLESAAILGSPSHGGLPSKNATHLQDKSVPLPKEKSSGTSTANTNTNTYMESAQRKQFSSAPPPSNMMHGPAFIFPFKQQKSSFGDGSPPPPPPPPPPVSSSSASSTTTMSFNYAGFSPNDAQYMAILQNNAYPFPIAAPPHYRGANPAQAIPFFNGPFYSSLLTQQQQQIKQGHQNLCASSDSSSSQKQQGPGGGGAPANLHGVPSLKQQSENKQPQAYAMSFASFDGSAPTSQQQPQQQMIQKQQQQQQLMQLMSTRPPTKSSPAPHINNGNIQSDRTPVSSTIAARFPQDTHTDIPPSLIQGSSRGVAAPSPASSSLTSSSSNAKNQISQQQAPGSGGAPANSHGVPSLKQQNENKQPQAYAMSFASFAGSVPPSQHQLQQQQHQHQLQHQHQQMLEKQQQHLKHLMSSRPPAKSSPAPHINNGNIQSDRTPGSMAARFPQGVHPDIPPSLIQGSSRGVATPSPVSSSLTSPPASSAKNQISQQQQISFGITPNKPLGAVTANAIGSPHNSVSKGGSAAAGSPTLPLQQQQAAASSSNLNKSSILGHPSITSTSNSKQQKQSFPHPQLFFNSPSITQPSGFHQQQQQKQQNSTTSGMFSLCPASVASDPTKGGLAATQQAGILQYATSSMAPHHLMSAAAAFPYIHTNSTPPSVSLKQPAVWMSKEQQSKRSVEKKGERDEKK